MTLPLFVAGLSPLQLALVVVAVTGMLALAAAAGFFVARRGADPDVRAEVGLYQREMVRQKRRTQDGGSMTTLIRRERDRARRHVQRTMRMRQAAHARAAGKPVGDRRAMPTVNILRPVLHTRQSEVGQSYQAGGVINRVRESTKSLFSASPRVQAPHEPVMETMPAGIEAFDPQFTAPPMVAAPAPAMMQAPAIGSEANVPMAAVPVLDAGTAPQAAMEPSSPVARRIATVAKGLAAPSYRTPLVATPASTVAPAPASPRVQQSSASEDESETASTSSDNLKRRLAQVRERRSPQRSMASAAAQPMVKTS